VYIFTIYTRKQNFMAATVDNVHLWFAVAVSKSHAQKTMFTFWH